MFKNIKETIVSLNNGTKTVANCEKAKALKKKLLKIGILITIMGMVGIIVCYTILKSTEVRSLVNSIFFVLLLPVTLVMFFGIATIISAINIAITGYTTNLIDEAIGNNCPKCDNEITPEETYCSNCGEQLKKECNQCHYINDVKANYCNKCGNKL